MQSTVSQAQALKVLFSNRILTMETLLEIENKDRTLVPFKLQAIQRDMLETSTPRDIYVKPGQIGATSVHVADFYLDNITINGTVSVIISYDDFSAERLLLKAKKYHRSLERRIPTIPHLDHKSATELSWENKKTNFSSFMYIFSARSYTKGRGEAIHNLLLDEYAFWPPGTHEDVFASAVQRVPLKVGTKVRFVSTPNGEDNPFCEFYRAAKEGTVVAKSVYKHHFYPWYLHEEYMMLADDDFCLEADAFDPLPNITAEEQILIQRINGLLECDDFLAQAKIRWRRYKIAEMASMRRSGETIFIFPQEYPEDDETCFITAGGQAYNADIVETKIRNCIPAPITHNLVSAQGLSASVDIWHDKEEGRGYVIGIDPGKGKTSESVASVWTFYEGYTDKDGKEHSPILQHCATLAGFYDEAEMGDYCKLLGHYFNGAVLAPEDNLDLVSHVRDYPDLYWREDVRTGKVSRSIGWQTNVSTKPYMITEVNRLLEYLDCQDSRFWSQCKNIRRNASVKSGIIVVGADDHHDAGAITVVCRDAQPVHRGFVGVSGWSDSWGR